MHHDTDTHHLVRDGVTTADEASRKAEFLPVGTDLFDDVRTLSRLVREQASGRFYLELWATITAIAALVYFLTIPDAIPDLIPVAGYVDDAAVVGAAVSVLRSELHRFRVWEQTHG